MGDIVSVKNSAERMYERGSKAAYSGDYLNAVYYLKEAVKKKPDNPFYITDLAFALNEVGRYSEAIQYAASGAVLKLEPGQEGILYYIMGEAYIGLGDYLSAAKLLRASIQSSPDGQYSNDALNYLTELNESGEEEQEQPEEADIQDFEAEQMLEQARLMSVTVGREHMSLELLKQYTEKYGETIPSLETMILVLYYQNEWELLLDYAYKLLNMDAGSVFAMVYGYIAAAQLSDSVKESYFEGLIEDINECYPRELELLYRFFDWANNPPLAVRVLFNLYNGDDYNIQLVYALGAAYYNNHDIKGAFEMFGRLYLLDGGSPEAAGFREMLSQTFRPESLSYIYALPPGMQEEGDAFLLKTLESGVLPEPPFDLIRYAMLYGPIDSLKSLVARLPFDSPGVLSVIAICLCGEKMDIIRKKEALDALFDAGLDLRGLPVSNGGELINGESFRALYRYPVVFTVSRRITSKYSEAEVQMNMAMIYKLMQGRPVNDINEINAALEILLCREHDEKFDIGELSKVYNISGEKIKEIISLLDGSNDEK